MYQLTTIIVFAPLGNATIGFVQSSYTVGEGDGTVNVCVQISALPADGLGCDLTVEFTLLAGEVASKCVRVHTM